MPRKILSEASFTAPVDGSMDGADNDDPAKKKVVQETPEKLRKMEGEARQEEALSAKAQELQGLKSREDFLLANISASQATIIDLKKQQSEREQVLIQKKELVHNQEAQIAVLERELQQLLREEDEGRKERKSLREEASQLAKTLRKRKEAALMLRKQRRNTEAELRGGRRAVEKAAETCRELSVRVEEMELDFGGSVRELKRQRVKMQGTLRREAVVRRDAWRASGRCQGEAQRLVAAETRRLSLHLAERELHVESGFRREMHLATTVLSRRDGRKLRAELSQRRRRAAALRGRYQTVASSLPSEGEVMTPASPADRELQGRLDSWTQKVCEKRAEVKALERSLRAHGTQTSAPPQGPGTLPRSAERRGVGTLSAQKGALEEQCCWKRKKIVVLQQEIKEEQSALDELLRREAVLLRRVSEARSQAQFLQQQLRPQEAAMDQARQQCAALTLEIQAWKMTEEEGDSTLSDRLDFSKEVDLILPAVMSQQTDLGSVLRLQFQQVQHSLSPSQYHLGLPAAAPCQGPTPATTPPCSPTPAGTPTCSPTPSGTPPCSPTPSGTPTCSLGRGSSGPRGPSPPREGSDSTDLALKLAVTKALLCATLFPDSSQGCSPHSNSNGNGPPIPPCPPNTPEVKRSPRPPQRELPKRRATEALP